MNPQGALQTEHSRPPPGPAPYRWVILGMCSMAQAALVMACLALSPLGPFLLADLALTRAELGLMVSVVLLGAAVSSTPGGWLADRSIRWTLMGGQAFLGLMMLLFTRSTSLEASLVPLFLAGMGLGASSPAVARAIASWFPARERATAMGLTMASAPVGNAVAAAFMPTVAELWGWRAALLPAAILVIITGAISLLLYRPSPEDAAIKRAGRPAGGGAWRMLLKRDTWLLALTAIFFGASEHSFRTYFMLHLTDIAQVPVVLGGWYLTLSFVGGLFGRIAWGAVTDRWFEGRREKVFAAIPGLAALAFVFLALGWGSPWAFPFLAAVLGFTVMGWAALWTTMLSERANSGSAGGELGLGFTFSYVGIVIGPVLFGRGLDLTGSYQAMWLIAAGVSALSGAFPLFLKGTGVGSRV